MSLLHPSPGLKDLLKTAKLSRTYPNPCRITRLTLDTNLALRLTKMAKTPFGRVLNQGMKDKSFDALTFFPDPTFGTRCPELEAIFIQDTRYDDQNDLEPFEARIQNLGSSLETALNPR